jgi:hypothetical protein
MERDTQPRARRTESGANLGWMVTELKSEAGEDLGVTRAIGGLTPEIPAIGGPTRFRFGQ